MPKFSIIIPIYNAQEYLKQSLSSACAQTYGDIEIVCVDDGSTDASYDIVTERAQVDPRVRLVEKENGGPSSARNAGIKAARGEYICFLDADDSLDVRACERLARELGGYESDAIVFGWSYEPADEVDRFVREHAEVRYAFYEQFDPKLLFEEMTNPYLRLAIRRDALLESGVMFNEDLWVGEDCLFLFSLYPRIGSVRLIADKLYRYRLPHPGSIMSEYKHDVESLCIHDLDATIGIFESWNAGGFLKPYASQLFRWFVKGQLYTILRLDPGIRSQFVALIRDLWLAYFTPEELAALDLDEKYARLVDIVVGASEDGALAVSERELSQALMSWRIAEYGMRDLVATVAQKTASKLLDNRRMLLKNLQTTSTSIGRGAQILAEKAQLPLPSAPREASPEPAPYDPVDDAVPTPAGDEELDLDVSDEVAPVVSVIVPVYNVERYLAQALRSIQRQTLRQIEIICVNDGSTDSSLGILHAHAELDGRFRIIDKENGGYGSACNRGIQEARGIWIAIVEPDDWIDENMYRAMVDYAATFGEPVDIVKTPYWRVWMPDTDDERTINCSYRGRITPKKQPFKLTDEGATHLIIHHPSIWSALYRRDFIERAGIRFMEIPGAGWADNPFLAETLVQADSIVYLDEPFYHYREETPEKTESFGRDGWKVSIDRWHDMMDVYERLGVTDERIRRAHIRRGFTYLGLVLEYHSVDEPDIREAALGMFARMDDDLVFSEPNISPGSKQLYADVKSVPLPKISQVPYAVEVVKNGLYNLVNTGPAMTIDTFKSFIGSHAKREGK